MAGLNLSARQCSADHIANGTGAGKRFVWCVPLNEDMSRRAVGPSLLQIGSQGLAGS